MSNTANFAKPQYTYKRFRVKRPDGKSTTVSVEPSLVVKVCQIQGSLASVSQVVRDAALSYDEADASSKNRSAYVTKKLSEIVDKGPIQAAAPVDAGASSAA